MRPAYTRPSRRMLQLALLSQAPHGWRGSPIVATKAADDRQPHLLDPKAERKDANATNQ